MKKEIRKKMEKKRSPIVPIVLAVAIGLLTILLLNSVISPTPVVVAKVSIAPGTILSADLLEVRTLPAGGRPADGYSKIADVEGEMVAVGRAPGDPITTSVLGDNSSAGIPSQLEPGHVAIAVNVDLSSGVAGLLRPGQTVTVIGLLTPDVLSSQAGLARVIGSPLIIQDSSVVDPNRPTATPTATPTPEPVLGPVGRISIRGIRVLMVPQSFQYQEIPAGASQEELFASSQTTSQEKGVVVLDVPTTPMEVAPGVFVNPATLIAALDRFGGVYLALEPSGGLVMAEQDILTLNLAGLYQSINGEDQQNLPTATPTVKLPVVSTHTPTPTVSLAP
jgi:Flp pilus assembly protein CpaB